MNISELTEHSYVPYSGTPKFAVAKSKEGRYFPGCRIENISYPLSISAIHNALFCCISEGNTPQEVWAPHTEKSMISFWKEEFGVTVTTQEQSKWSDVSFPNLALQEEIPLDKTLKKLLDKAVVGESDFPVAALLETDIGFFSGVNIECSSWSMGLCAERVAIGKAVTYGAQNFKRLHIHTRDGEFSSPCGSCRQVIVEHMAQKQIHLHHADNTESVHFGHDLLPHSFRSSTLIK
ncbi:cytidine deaminase [Fodinibius halophilus]|uniref:Cytidine deaminase n=1 Tax=Fodinibius halophilus TaxID=1736908 RepID=A0A6M1TDG5_9BACT|nr:cytidine deaminase [Fodinibius halophilus]NGP86730.1 cytidine deaminase [Fodinibius halophilus]